MPSSRARAALTAAALAYTEAIGSSGEAGCRRRLEDAASVYRRASSDGVAACVFCGEQVRPGEVGSFVKVEGWAELRRAGGTHALFEQRPTGEVACESCIRSKRLGVDPSAQGSLLG